MHILLIVIDLHGDIVSQFLQDIPFLIDYINLIRDNARIVDEDGISRFHKLTNRYENQARYDFCSVNVNSYTQLRYNNRFAYTHSEECWIECPNIIGTSILISFSYFARIQRSGYGYPFRMYHVSEIECCFCRTDPEFLDECNSVFFVFRQSVATFFLQLPTCEDDESNVGMLVCLQLAVERIQGSYSNARSGIETIETEIIRGNQCMIIIVQLLEGRECKLGSNCQTT